MPKIVYKIVEYSSWNGEESYPKPKLYRYAYAEDSQDNPLNDDFTSLDAAMAALVSHCGQSTGMYYDYDIVIQVRL